MLFIFLLGQLFDFAKLVVRVSETVWFVLGWPVMIFVGFAPMFWPLVSFRGLPVRQPHGGDLCRQVGVRVTAVFP